MFKRYPDIGVLMLRKYVSSISTTDLPQQQCIFYYINFNLCFLTGKMKEHNRVKTGNVADLSKPELNTSLL